MELPQQKLIKQKHHLSCGSGQGEELSGSGPLLKSLGCTLPDLCSTSHKASNIWCGRKRVCSTITFSQ